MANKITPGQSKSKTACQVNELISNYSVNATDYAASINPPYITDEDAVDFMDEVPFDEANLSQKKNSLMKILAKMEKADVIKVNEENLDDDDEEMPIHIDVTEEEIKLLQISLAMKYAQIKAEPAAWELIRTQADLNEVFFPQEYIVYLIRIMLMEELNMNFDETVFASSDLRLAQRVREIISNSANLLSVIEVRQRND